MSKQTIEEDVKTAIRKNSEVFKKNENFSKNLEEYRRLKEMGIIKKKEFSLSRTDVIGYGRYNIDFQ